MIKREVGNWYVFWSVLVVALFASAPALAVTISGSADGSWNDIVTPGITTAGVSSDGTELFWPHHTIGHRHSHLIFTGDDNWEGETDGTPFILGQFEYKNEASSSFATPDDFSADLEFTFTIDSAPYTRELSFDISSPTNPTGDTILITPTSPVPIYFSYGDSEYELVLLGLADHTITDGPGTTSGSGYTWFLDEESIATANLMAQIRPVPLPPSLVLFGTSLLGLVGFRRRITFS